MSGVWAAVLESKSRSPAVPEPVTEAGAARSKVRWTLFCQSLRLASRGSECEGVSPTRTAPIFHEGWWIRCRPAPPGPALTTDLASVPRAQRTDKTSHRPTPAAPPRTP